MVTKREDNMIELGDKVKDNVSGLIGIATEKHEYLNGCIQFTVQAPFDKKTGEMPAWKLDEEQLEVADKKKVKIKKSNTGGPSTRVR